MCQMQVTEEMKVHVRSAKQERTVSQKYNADVKNVMQGLLGGYFQ